MGLQVLMGLEMALDNWYLFSIPKLVINYNNYVCSLHLFYLSLSLPHSNFIFLFSVVGCFSPCLFSKFDLITKFDAYWLVASALFKSLIFFFFLYDIANSCQFKFVRRGSCLKIFNMNFFVYHSQCVYPIFSTFTWVITLLPGNTTCYLLVNEMLQEIRWFKQPYSSWFLGDYVAEGMCYICSVPP